MNRAIGGSGSANEPLRRRSGSGIDRNPAGPAAAGADARRCPSGPNVGTRRSDPGWFGAALHVGKPCYSPKVEPDDPPLQPCAVFR